MQTRTWLESQGILSTRVMFGSRLELRSERSGLPIRLQTR
jgi:hypothetical protein